MQDVDNEPFIKRTIQKNLNQINRFLLKIRFDIWWNEKDLVLLHQTHKKNDDETLLVDIYSMPAGDDGLCKRCQASVCEA